MSNSVDLLKRHETLKNRYEQLQSELTRDETMLELKKEDVSKKRKELQEAGITFKSVKELKEKKQKMEESITQQVEKMEEVLGIDAADLEEDEDLEEIEI